MSERIWAYAIEISPGSFDVNAKHFFTKAAAEAAMKQHNRLFPDDRRCLVSRPPSPPWEREGKPTGAVGGYPNQEGDREN